MTFEDKIRTTITQHLGAVETVLYAAVAVILVVAVSIGVVKLAVLCTTTAGLLVLDHLLLVFILIEILHTVRISIRTRHLTMVPFLIVGLIASIRRVLVITMPRPQWQSKATSRRLSRPWRSIIP